MMDLSMNVNNNNNKIRTYHKIERFTIVQKNRNTEQDQEKQNENKYKILNCFIRPLKDHYSNR